MNSSRKVISWWMNGHVAVRWERPACNFSDSIIPQPSDPVQRINGHTSWS
jgi:hypothetical protein